MITSKCPQYQKQTLTRVVEIYAEESHTSSANINENSEKIQLRNICLDFINDCMQNLTKLIKSELPMCKVNIRYF